MTEADRGLVRRRLALMAGNLEDLAAIAGLSVAEFTSDRFRHKGAERLLHEVIEAAVEVLHGSGRAAIGTANSGAGGARANQCGRTLCCASELRRRPFHLEEPAQCGTGRT